MNYFGKIALQDIDAVILVIIVHVMITNLIA